MMDMTQEQEDHIYAPLAAYGVSWASMTSGALIILVCGVFKDAQARQNNVLILGLILAVCGLVGLFFTRRRLMRNVQKLIDEASNPSL